MIALPGPAGDLGADDAEKHDFIWSRARRTMPCIQGSTVSVGMQASHTLNEVNQSKLASRYASCGRRRIVLQRLGEAISFLDEKSERFQGPWSVP